MIHLIAFAAVAQASGPLDVARTEIAQVLGKDAARVSLLIRPSGARESYTITSKPPAQNGRRPQVLITGSDAVGVMYGAFEFAERLRNEGTRAWKTNVKGSPYLPQRGLNLFLTLPWDYKKNDTDYDVAALTDPNRWWFQNDDYWITLLDLMARSRLNWLDIHGTWDISVTNAPNLYAYFVTSKSFPLVGAPAEVKAACLKRLNWVIDMAHRRGIKVSLMAYEANLRIPQNPNPPYEASEANIYKYTREVVEEMIRKAPGLDAIGFRIGESGRSESFFKCYGEAVKASGRDIPLITRSWITRKQKVLPLARASKDFTVEIKYNGEQWGAPYMVAGGRMANWYSYSFEDYLSDSLEFGVSNLGASRDNVQTPHSKLQTRRALHNPRSTPQTPNTQDPMTAKLWPGWPAEGGGRWPSQPYKIVWQVRANGTHRIFPFYNPEMVRSTIKTMKIGTASGYTVEGLDAYYPKSPDYYLANPADKYCNWTHQRDEMYWMLWGRLGYDPATPNDRFENRMKIWFGSEAKQVARVWNEASSLVPFIFSAYALGPDHRNHAPELETGGSIEDFIQNQPFDPHVFRPIREEIAMRSLGILDGRLTPMLTIVQLEAMAHWVRATLAGPDKDALQDVRRIDESQIPTNGRTRYEELKAAGLMISNLADYYRCRFHAALNLANSDRYGAMGSNSATKKALLAGVEDWRALANSPQSSRYKPFTERLRMGTNSFTWKSSLVGLEAEAKRWERTSSNAPMLPWIEIEADDGAPPRKPPVLSWTKTGERVRATVTEADQAWLLVKPLPSSTFFHRVPMTKSGSSWVADFARDRFGYCLTAEVVQGRFRFRVPFSRGWAGQGIGAPYLVVPPESGPTPQIYSTEEAMAYLDPAVLKPEKYGVMLIAPRAWRFFNGFDKANKRKLLDPIERGMTLLVLQQDYTSGRYKLDWLPKPLTVENNPEPSIFDPGGALGLKRFECSDILWQRFKPSPGWEVFGNGAVAHMALGKGNIWLINGRLMQRCTNPDAARAIKQLLESCANPLTPRPPLPAIHRGEAVRKPIIIIDPGTEDAAYSTSFWPDMLNALDIPFLTLGEVIAKEQGMDSFTPIPGPVMDDDVLGGKGRDMANAFLRNEVIRASKRPTPKTLPEFEKEGTRRKAELMRCLGLDPMPPKTPLNARITGVIQREGYRIEKVVFESRPKFYVTAHVYVPESTTSGTSLTGPTRPNQPRLPVIVNVNGHWAHKKDEDRIQLRCAFQALQGYLAIAIDSPGWSFEGNSLIERRQEGNHNDWALVEGGINATGVYVWDAIRALDYVATRPDADMTRVGVTGASGGGLATLYAFAADDRYKAAVPVVYMSSMELAPDNGCLCNHVPGTSQIGDRSDVLSIQAPKPVLIMGAQDDPEFPPDAMRLTQKKAQEIWALFEQPDLGQLLSTINHPPSTIISPPPAPSPLAGTRHPESGEGVSVRIFPGPHDYNQGMREAMIGFFNLHLKGEGDGSPVPQPSLSAIDPEDRRLLALDPAPTDERTMRDIALECLAKAAKPPSENAIAINGGLPRVGLLNYKEIGTGSKRAITLESEAGLVTPGLLVLPRRALKGVRIVASDEGKQAEVALPASAEDGWATLYLDTIGTGELAGIEMRYPLYLGRSAPFIGGWQMCRAAEAMRPYSDRIEIVGRGPITSQAVMWAGLMGRFSKVTGYDCLRRWEDVFEPGVSPYAIQPRANLCGTLDQLRSQVINGEWHFRQVPSPR